MTVTLADPSVSALFVIPEDQWTAINQRVALVIEASPVAGMIDQSLPGFGDLESKCQLWKQSTFQRIVDQSTALAQYCDGAIAGFQGIGQQLSNGGAVSPATLDAARQAIAALTTATAQFRSGFDPLSADVVAFANANQKIDGEITQIVAQELGGWTELTEELQAVDQATGHVRGAWDAITHDLDAVGSGQVPLTTETLIAIDVNYSLRQWRQLASEAQAFPSMAAGQQQILNG